MGPIFFYLLPSFLPSLLTYLLTRWSRVLLEKLTGLQLVKKFSAFYGTWRFITAVTSAHHLSLYSASSIQFIIPRTTSWRSILILPPIDNLISQVVSFPQVSPPETMYSLSSPAYVLHAPSISFFSILSLAQYWVSSTGHSAHQYAVFSALL